MFGGPIVEIVLVLLFVFVTMSAIVSSAQELIFQVFGWRARNLRRTIERMLADNTYGNEIGGRIYRHPLLNSGGGARKQVTHIDPETFAIAFAAAVQPSWSTGDPVAALPESIDALKEGELKHRLKLIIPQPLAGQDYRETILQSLNTWFDAAIRKSQESYKADARALAYVIAAVVTVTLNVSPIEITQRMMSDKALRTSVSSAMPQLTPLLGTASAAPSAVDAVQQLSAPAANMLALVQCSEAQTSLPIGWSWMAGALDAASSKKPDAASGAFVQEERACKQAAARVEDGGGVESLVEGRTFERQFGPTFRTDPPLLILAGWLITVIAAAQGSPFWFSLIQKLIRR